MNEKQRKWFDSAIIKEDESKATANSKHFIMNNGTRKAVFSPTNINYYDRENKKWETIDNAIENTQDGYQVKIGSYVAKLSNNDNHETVEVTDGASTICWKYMGVNKNVFYKLFGPSNVQAEKHKSKLNIKPKIHGAMDLGMSSHMIFQNADEYVDLDYKIEGNNIKENIVVKEKSDKYNFYFSFHVSGFETKVFDNGNYIEFYKKQSGESENPEFVMNPPFMCDANGSRSDAVHYALETIDDENYIFSINADPEWINAPERVFPICIDPQLTTVNTHPYISVSQTRYEWCECSDCSCLEPNWVCTDNPDYGFIYLYNDDSTKINATVHVSKCGIDFTRNTLISARLIFHNCSENSYMNSATIKVGETAYSHFNEKKLTVDITDQFNASSGSLSLEMEMLSSGMSRCFEQAPVLEVEYQPIGDFAVRKALSVGDGVSAELDVLSGNGTLMFDDISDPVLGVTVAHIYKPNDKIAEYGTNFRLNLDEKLEKVSSTSTGAQYVYTDAKGDKHTFDEHFYHIGNDGEKEYITSDIECITADVDGRLWLNGAEVFRELTTKRGLKATARLEEVNNAEWIEQRLDEEKQIEEQVKSYKSTLCNFVVVNTDNGEIISTLNKDELDATDSVETFLSKVNSTSLLLSKEEAMSYQSLKTQVTSLNHSHNSLYTQRFALNNSAKVVWEQLDADDGTLNDKQKALVMEQLSQYDLGNDRSTDYDGYGHGVYKEQYDDIEAQFPIVATQISNTQCQINYYANKSNSYFQQFKTYYKEFLNLNNQLEKLKMQVPVSYLISDSAVKGFNEKGELVIVQDRYGKYIVVECEKYDAYGKTRISAVYDQDGKTMKFLYNDIDKLSEITNSIGQRTSFSYDSEGYLVAIERDQLPSLEIAYSSDQISEVSFSNNISAAMTYNLTGMLTGITHSTTVSAISNGKVTESGITTLSTVGVQYTETETKITYDNNKKVIYKINQDTEQVTAYYELIDNKVSHAERYTYNDYLLTKTEQADKSCLNRYPYENFGSYFVMGTVENVTYNSFDEPTLVEKELYSGNSRIEVSQTEYVYNDERKLTQKKTTHSYYNNGVASNTTVVVEKYYYDNVGELVRKESYVEGEELTTGINIEEHVFNDQGIEIQSFTYNSLDASSKFYTENEVDEQGRTLAAFDDSGEHKTTFDYERDGVTVKTERLPNGSKFSYGRAKDGTVTAITHSTENGEENSTNKIYTSDVVTEVKSGNNTVRYTYDGKRRVKSVSLNGVENYVTYEYRGEHTDSDRVEATMANGATAITIKNSHGNVKLQTISGGYISNTYNTDQQLTKTVDSVSGETTLTYDDKGNVTTVTTPSHAETFVYDNKNVLTSKTVDGKTYSFTHKPTAANALDSITVDGKTVRPATDALGRNTGKTIEVGANKIAEEKISYVKFGDHATNLPSTVRFATNGVFRESMQYRYDSMGNIIEVFENGRSACRYEYDALGRLTREDNVAFGKTTTWAYDNNGNIIARYEYAITAKPTRELHLLDCTCINYAYDDNSDQLLSYGDETFVYDVIGNPTTYRGKSATWAYGRQLTSFDGNTFAYDARGRRIGKNGITFTYDSNGNLIKQSNGLEFLYDHSGVFALKYNGSTYFYRKDAQANIVALLDNTGAVVVKYKYDAWGKCNTVVDSTANTIAELNPFRYRSYYLDTETGLYFLKTRYYDPEIGRFITIDDISYLDPESINGLNLYAYCFNNPVMMIDESGCAPAWWEWLISGLTLAAGIALCFVPGGQVFGVGLIVAGASGLVSNTMNALGVNGKIATLISSGLSIVAGIALCFTPFAGIGAGLIGQGVGSIVGGYISESLGGSFELGAAIGGIAGSLFGGLAYRGITSYRLSHMTAAQKGTMGERYVKALYGNRVEKITEGPNRPDFVFKNSSKLIEVKNVASQSMTHQLKRYLSMGKEVNIIYVRLGTKISSALKNSGYIIKRFPW